MALLVPLSMVLAALWVARRDARRKTDRRCSAGPSSNTKRL